MSTEEISKAIRNIQAIRFYEFDTDGKLIELVKPQEYQNLFTAQGYEHSDGTLL